MDAMDIQAVESKLSDVTVTPIPMSATRNSNLLNSHRSSPASSYQQHLPQIQISAVPKQSSASSAYNHRQSNNVSSSSNHHDHALSLASLGASTTITTTTQTSANITTPMTSTANIPSTNQNNNHGLTKYAQLLAVIEEMGRDIRPTYTGSRNSTERLKRGIVHARILVRECLMETERSARQ